MAFDTVNPPGQEADCAALIAQILSAEGFEVELHTWDAGRSNVLARLPASVQTDAALLLTGHMDTVPLGSEPWTLDPFGGEVVGDKLYGRGASDMKGGVAAMITAAISIARSAERTRKDLVLLFTSGEETGCEGAQRFVQERADRIPAVDAIVVGEPTSNSIALGHKGALCWRAHATGRTAHSSMPHLGDNAIYKAAHAIVKLAEAELPHSPESTLGPPTLNVGMVSGGLNFNSVPDQATFTIDVRTNEHLSSERIRDILIAEMVGDLRLDPLLAMPAVFTSPQSGLVICALEQAARIWETEAPRLMAGVPFFSDASVLGPHFGCPVILFGPGEPAQAHRVDEWCKVSAIHEAVRFYRDFALSWCR